MRAASEASFNKIEPLGKAETCLLLYTCDQHRCQNHMLGLLSPV